MMFVVALSLFGHHGTVLATDSAWQVPAAAREAWVLCRQASLPLLNELSNYPTAIADAVLQRCDSLFVDAAIESLAADARPRDAAAIERMRASVYPEVRAGLIAEVQRAREVGVARPIDQSGEALYRDATQLFELTGDPLDVHGESALRYAAAVGHRLARCDLAYIYVLHGLDKGTTEKVTFYTTRSVQLLAREMASHSPCAARTMRLIRGGQGG